jgi:chaperonin cofactor prefoldin
VPCRNAAEERAERTNGRATALAEALAELAPPETLEGLNQRIEVLERQMARANKIIDAIGKAMKDAMNG